MRILVSLQKHLQKLAHKGGSTVDQIRLSLGHYSIQTTEKYLGVEQDLTDLPYDYLGLRISNKAAGRAIRRNQILQLNL